ncbi:MAG: hypothetical protein FJ291_28865 [Planctomycetes bacterium]|nr:hypothetical protein [Planctomycetota bacterium]
MAEFDGPNVLRNNLFCDASQPFITWPGEAPPQTVDGAGQVVVVGHRGVCLGAEAAPDVGVHVVARISHQRLVRNAGTTKPQAPSAKQAPNSNPQWSKRRLRGVARDPGGLLWSLSIPGLEIVWCLAFGSWDFPHFVRNAG